MNFQLHAGCRKKWGMNCNFSLLLRWRGREGTWVMTLTTVYAKPYMDWFYCPTFYALNPITCNPALHIIGCDKTQLSYFQLAHTDPNRLPAFEWWMRFLPLAGLLIFTFSTFEGTCHSSNLIKGVAMWTFLLFMWSSQVTPFYHLYPFLTLETRLLLCMVRHDPIYLQAYV